MRTRCKDKNHKAIWEGDILHVEEYPDQYVGGSLDFEGVVTIEDGKAMVTYLDIGEEESYPISYFPLKGREIMSENYRHSYWKTLHLGGEPNEGCWKEELYRDYFDSRRRERENEDDR